MGETKTLVKQSGPTESVGPQDRYVNTAEEIPP